MNTTGRHDSSTDAQRSADSAEKQSWLKNVLIVVLILLVIWQIILLGITSATLDRIKHIESVMGI